VRLAQAGESACYLPIRAARSNPTASVKRGVFAPADTWVSTEYLFRKDDDGDFWLVDNRGSVIRTATDPSSPRQSTTPRTGRCVDLSVTYGVEVEDRYSRSPR